MDEFTNNDDDDDDTQQQEQISESITTTTSDEISAVGASDNSEEEPIALPRDHSYLVTPHPLVADQKPPSKLCPNDGRGSKKRFVDLAVLELYGVVLFPGSTIPVKLRDRSWIEFLGRQIAVLREFPHLQSEVRLGILAHKPDDPTERRSERSDSSRSTMTRSLVGRIGTIATIKHTHESADDDLTPSNSSDTSSNVWRRYQDGTELVFTAVGTHRFRIIGPASPPEQGNGIGNRTYEVEELMDTPLPLPPIQRIFSTPPEHMLSMKEEGIVGEGTKNEEEIQKNDGLHRHAVRAWCLSQISPTPYFVHRNKSPWRVASQVVQKINAASAGGGRDHHLPCLTMVDEADSSSSSKTSPSASSLSPAVALSDTTKFSFWCASNLPLSESDRLQLLEVPSTYERLLLVKEHVEELSASDTPIVCARCDQALSKVRDVFTVRGAEGTTSAYVNDHGYIHQITTLRQVNARSIVLEGIPHAENSYFPGYSWTVCYCRSCLSLLGWMFRPVHRDMRLSKDRPEKFFGFMSSSVSALEGRRRTYHRQQHAVEDGSNRMSTSSDSESSSESF